MRVLLLTYEYPPLGGGAGVAAWHITQALAERGVAYQVITAAPGGREPRPLPHRNVRVQRIPVGGPDAHYQSSHSLFMYSWLASLAGFRAMRRERFDLCHAFFSIPSGVSALALSWGFPYVVSLRGSDVPGFNPRFRSLHRIAGPVNRLVCHRARAVTAVSSGLATMAESVVHARDITVIPNGVDTLRFHPSENHESRTDSLTAISVGRLIARKGFPDLLRAWARLVESRSACSLRIVGDGPDQFTLENIINELGIGDSVELAGRMSWEAMPDVLRAADLFVLPSHNEGMSNALLEAMASGLPVVSTNVGGAVELLGDYPNVIVSRGDVGALARVLGQLLDDQERRERLGRAMRRKAESLSWHAVADAYLRLYQGVTSGT